MDVKIQIFKMQIILEMATKDLYFSAMCGY